MWLSYTCTDAWDQRRRDWLSSHFRQPCRWHIEAGRGRGEGHPRAPMAQLNATCRWAVTTALGPIVPLQQAEPPGPPPGVPYPKTAPHTCKYLLDLFTLTTYCLKNIKRAQWRAQKFVALDARGVAPWGALDEGMRPSPTRGRAAVVAQLACRTGPGAPVLELAVCVSVASQHEKPESWVPSHRS